ncbi:hypothetical protein [Streptomyces scabiei]|nr:hypothetical protein [Streptomyces sp. LBUM 1475]
MPIRSIALPEYGEHYVRLAVDSAELTTLSFSLGKGEISGVTSQMR